MDQYLAGFLMHLKKPDGSDYQPDTITSYQRGIGRALKEMGCPFDVVHDKQFALTRDVLATKRKILKRAGHGNRPNKAAVLTDEQEELLWTTAALGDATASSTQNTMWYLFSKLFGWRGRDESRQLCWGDVTLTLDESGTGVLSFNERTTKTRSGQAGGSLREFVPKIWPNNTTARCPIAIYKKFESKRPAKCKSPDFPFFLTICHRPGDEWYFPVPMGERYLGNRMAEITKAAGLVEHFTNHSVRKTGITQLVHAGIHPNQVAQLSGHRNVGSINNYSAASVEQQQTMCRILQHQTATASTTASPSTSTSTTTTPFTVTASTMAGLFQGATFNAPVTINVVASASSLENV